MPGTLSDLNAMRDINLAIFNPCSASGIAFPTIKSSIWSGLICGTVAIRCWITLTAKSSGRVNLNPPLLALPTALLNPVTIYAFIIVGVWYELIS